MSKNTITTIMVTMSAVLTVSLGTVSASDTASSAPIKKLQPSTPVSNLIPGTKCKMFPANNWWHADISTMPINRYSSVWMKSANAATKKLHPDFGPSFGEQPAPYGIPITVVNIPKPAATVKFDYADESDNVKYPLTPKTLIEGGYGPTVNTGGDQHAIVVNTATCTLYETWATLLTKKGWTAGSGAVWSLNSNALRPEGWTSADYAGLPIAPGLLRWEEVKNNHIDHAIRFTLARTDRSHTWPARHLSAKAVNPNLPPAGARFRLKQNFNTTQYSPYAKRILAAMKKYGLVLADNGSDWFFQGDASTGWNIGLVDELKKIPASSFEAIDSSSLKIANNSAQARP